MRALRQSVNSGSFTSDAMYSGLKWMRKRKAAQLIAQDKQRIRAEIRAGKDPEDVLGGFDLEFGLKLLRYMWLPPALVIGGAFGYLGVRARYDIDYCFYLMSKCSDFCHVENLVRNVEYVRPKFQEELFQAYEMWLDEANRDPEEFIKSVNFAQFDKWCDWIEKLKYQAEREAAIHRKFQTEVMVGTDGGPPDLPSMRKKKSWET
mmetsp:Transcript_5978/g.9517  ORF Transcript_5978/g.9517 Transcript_5978/m.9517 type:complete len:205 (-) Transcript_5978:150-764(-)|eukprot:CAMPEP_0202728152 /NCGR_PEP_ID=MMETSP1385-20130828/185484_1 /ASSEMBLY_ACC=CAM_ASM_000861 /TAXON_ID=933848 /ORGANISM="Elphidium margaritaceum" /LENGTH=204 /DNA_ID=CAMNT_0049394399 /DNA_START=33 /DNA_END=647 /DNA_ORIENTATION=+